MKIAKKLVPFCALVIVLSVIFACAGAGLEYMGALDQTDSGVAALCRLVLSVYCLVAVISVCRWLWEE